ncbi:3-oxoacyl-ACP synthase III family protein [Actinomadura gamaensis]|uniref:3-oxoacyl-ACP synthase III family protein n=1 Tax=Actinomadura gamaensis TaxID=1763541 RepID=A0ABV9TXD0_9ACTN
MTAWMTTEGGGDPRRTPYGVRFESVGRCLPATRLGTGELMGTLRHRHARIDLERLTGIRERRVAGAEHTSLSLAVSAAEDALSRSRHRPEAVEALLSCGITKYREGLTQWLEPPQALAVARRIGASGALAFDLSNACAGMLTGVFVVADRIMRGEISCGMVVGGEDISPLAVNAARHVRSVFSRELASLTLGDAGAAIVLERAPKDAPGIEFAAFTTIARHSRMCLAYPSRHAPGARMFTDARGIHRVAVADTPALLREALDAVGIEIGEIDHVIPHQTSARAIRKGMAEATRELGGAPRNPAVVTVDRYGNTASTTHTVALVEEIRAGRIRPGDRVALVALASGLEIGIVLFTVDERLVEGHGDHD